MNVWPTLAWSAAIVGGAAALYGLHRLALRLEERGHLYYLHKKAAGGSSAGAFVGLQRIVEPGTEHVLIVREEKAVRENDGIPGGGPLPPRVVGDETSERGV